MDFDNRTQRVGMRWPLLLSVVFLNVCLPNLVLSYGVVWVHLSGLAVPLWMGLSTSAIFMLTYGLSQCWFREAADSWGGSNGYRIMAVAGLICIAVGIFSCAFISFHLHPLFYGIFGGLGSSLISAQVDAVIFESYDSRLIYIRGMCFAGQAVGQTIFPHILTAIIDVYGYSFAYIVLAGIVLQTLPAILFLKIDDTVRKPISYSRYKDVSRDYVVYKNEALDNFYGNEVQLNNLNKKCWKNPSDDQLHREEELQCVVNSIVETITPPPSPEEKRRNIFGVDILPEIPEESEESDSEERTVTDNMTKNKVRLSVAIKRLSILGDNLDGCIVNQVRRDSQPEGENKEYTEVEVRYETIAPMTDIQTEKIFNSFSYRCQSAYMNLKRNVWIPSYRMYRIKRRFTFIMYSINDTLLKPLTRSLSCGRFYPALLLSFARLSLMTISIVLLPMIALEVQPKITILEMDFLMSLHGFTWICFLLCTPWLAQTPKRNYKYVLIIGLIVSTTSTFVLAADNNHDSYSIGCVIAGFGYGAVTSCWETSIQDFVGARKWPKIHSTLETLSSILLAIFVIPLSFIVDTENGLQLIMFILGNVLAAITFIWLLIALVYIYYTKVKNANLNGRSFF